MPGQGSSGSKCFRKREGETVVVDAVFDEESVVTIFLVGELFKNGSVVLAASLTALHHQLDEGVKL
jgi:hypothetical protein